MRFVLAALVLTAIPILSGVSHTACADDGRVAAHTSRGAEAVTLMRGGYFPSQLTVFNRDGSVRLKVGAPDAHGEPALSPDGRRVATTLRGMIRIYDLSTGSQSEMLPSPPAEARHLAWSPDGKCIAFVGIQDRRFGLYRIAADGSGLPEMLHRGAPGEPIFISDWSDERFLLFQSRGVLSMVLVGQGRALELVRGPYVANHGKLSPDHRYLAYWSDESGRGAVFVRPFDSTLPGLQSDGRKWNVSGPGARSPVYWRQDGRALYYRTSPREVMAVKTDVSPTFMAAAPELLFEVPAEGDAALVLAGGSISRDGKTFLFNVRTPPERKVLELDAKTLQRYTGRYAMANGADLLFALGKGGFTIQRVSPAGSEEKQPLLAEGPNRFFVRLADQDRDYEFETDDQGLGTQVTAYFGSMRVSGTRK